MEKLEDKAYGRQSPSSSPVGMELFLEKDSGLEDVPEKANGSNKLEVPYKGEKLDMDIIDGYKKESLLGGGGFGEVYLVTDEDGNYIAMKIPRLVIFMESPQSIKKKFLEEAKHWEMMFRATAIFSRMGRRILKENSITESTSFRRPSGKDWRQSILPWTLQ